MHRKEVTHSNGSYERKSRGRKLADEMGRAKKCPWYTHKTDAPEESDLWTTWQLFPLDDDQTCDFKDRVCDRVGVELLYNSVKTKVKTSSWVPVPVEFEFQLESSGRESHTRRKGLGALINWGPEKMLMRCSKESQHPAESTPGPPVEHQENEKDTTLTAIRVGVKIFQFCSVSSSLSHTNLE